MDDNHKIGLVFSLTGLIAGLISGSGYLTIVPSVVLAFVIFYGSQYLVKLVKVDMTKFNRSKILKSGFFSFLGCWLLFWIIIFNS